MPTRREFLNLAVAATGITTSTRPARAATSATIEALAFDALATFDLRPVFTLPSGCSRAEAPT